MSEEQISIDDIYLAPVNFFTMEIECHQAKEGKLTHSHLLPDMSELCVDDSIAEVYLGWEPAGIRAAVKFKSTIELPAPNKKTAKAPSIELLIDTRDLKSAGFNTRFCHHFLFTHEGGREITKFRTEDSHELCNPTELILALEGKKSNPVFQIFIPSQCLFGYDPEQLNRLGFTYRILAPEYGPQHFSVVSDEYQIDQNPALWSSLILIP